MPLFWPVVVTLRARGRLASLQGWLTRLAAASGTSGPSRREIVAAQLPMVTWPEKRVLIVTVNAETGERRAFDSDSGIDLVDAVIASTAFFG